jgi:putative phosphoribosyl transferase
MSNRFPDRITAGRALADRLASMHFAEPPVVLALPRGGVPVAAVVARRLHAPLDLLMVRKIGAPWQPELALAAVVDGEHPDIVIDEDLRDYAQECGDYIEKQMAIALREIERRRQVYLQGRAAVPLKGRTVIVVDDGIATGTTVRAALRALRRREPARLVLAVPVAPSDVVAKLRGEVDDLVCLSEPFPFQAVGLHYADFHAVGDDEVLAALRSAAPEAADPLTPERPS